MRASKDIRQKELADINRQALERMAAATGDEQIVRLLTTAFSVFKGNEKRMRGWLDKMVAEARIRYTARPK